MVALLADVSLQEAARYLQVGYGKMYGATESMLTQKVGYNKGLRWW
jgi:hypothetical protein